jgi:hypothetical protein
VERPAGDAGILSGPSPQRAERGPAQELTVGIGEGNPVRPGGKRRTCSESAWSTTSGRRTVRMLLAVFGGPKGRRLPT